MEELLNAYEGSNPKLANNSKTSYYNIFIEAYESDTVFIVLGTDFEMYFRYYPTPPPPPPPTKEEIQRLDSIERMFFKSADFDSTEISSYDYEDISDEERKKLEEEYRQDCIKFEADCKNPRMRNIGPFLYGKDTITILADTIFSNKYIKKFTGRSDIKTNQKIINDWPGGCYDGTHRYTRYYKTRNGKLVLKKETEL